jgi:hypothetical protein
MVREAYAIWKDGPYAVEGTLSTPSGVLNNSRYTFGSLTGPAASTSPCEMLAAAISSQHVPNGRGGNDQGGNSTRRG